MAKEIHPHFSKASSVTKSLVNQMIERDALGQKKYGQTMDRQDLGLSDWLEHAIEEMLDCVEYLRAAQRALDPDLIPEVESPDIDENETARPDSNATELPLSSFLLSIFANHDSKDIRKALTELFDAEPTLARVIGNAFAGWEANSYLDRPDKVPSDVMLRMVGGFDREQQRDLLQEGLEHPSLGRPVKFVTIPNKK